MSSKKKNRGKAYKKKKSTMQSLLKPTAKQVISNARSYPVYHCLLLDNWRTSGMTHVILTREQPEGHLIFVDILVDLLCLGVKDCFLKANMPRSKYHSEFLARTEELGRLIDTPLDLAHAIVYGAVDYARSLGFEPHPDYQRCQMLLEPREAFDELPEVEFGIEGKPRYVSGPYDDIDFVLETLRDNVGEGNFDTFLML